MFYIYELSLIDKEPLKKNTHQKTVLNRHYPGLSKALSEEFKVYLSSAYQDIIPQQKAFGKHNFQSNGNKS